MCGFFVELDCPSGVLQRHDAVDTDELNRGLKVHLRDSVPATHVYVCRLVVMRVNHDAEWCGP